MIEPKHPALPVKRQCELLGLARASYYHKPEPDPWVGLLHARAQRWGGPSLLRAYLESIMMRCALRRTRG